MEKTVIHFTDSTAFGGLEKDILYLLAGLDRKRWRPVLLCPPEPGLDPLLSEARQLKIEVHIVPRMQTMRHLVRLPKLIRALQAERPSILHAHLCWPLSCKYAILAAAMARVPVVVATAHLYFELSRKSLLHFLPRLISTGVDRYLAVSQSVARQLCDEFRIPAAKVNLVHNAIPANPFLKPANLSLKKTLAGAKNRPIVLAVARLDKPKGQTYLIEAAVQIPEAMFVLAGEGPDRTALEAHARSLGVDDRILFLGYRKDIPDLLACCDVFVLPSLYEGLPLAILEAMAAGKPVIASAIRGNDEVIENGKDGLLVPPADPAGLASAIRTLLSDLTLARRLAEKAKAKVSRDFNVEKMVERVVHVYEELTE